MVLQLKAFSDFQYNDPSKIIVTEPWQFNEMINFLSTRRHLVFDHETTGLNWFQGKRSIGLGLASWDNNGSLIAYYIPYRHMTGQKQLDIEAIRPALKHLFSDANRLYIAHNWKFDAHFNMCEGWDIAGPAYDTMIAARIYNEHGSMQLEVVAARDLGIGDAAFVGKNAMKDYLVALAKQQKKGYKAYISLKGYSEVDTQLCGYYCCTDVTHTANLYAHYENYGLSTIYSRIMNTEMSLVKVLVAMERNGLPVDIGYLENLDIKCRSARDKLQDKMGKFLGRPEFNPDSENEVRLALFGYLKLRPIKKTKPAKGKPPELSVDKEVLAFYEDTHEFCKWLKEWREANKIISSYSSSMPKLLDDNGYLHGNMQQVGTITGRLSCRDPNYQNMPNESNARAIKNSGKSLEDGGIDPWSIRRAFVMRPGYVRLFADYSQVELRVLAKYSMDPIMVEAYATGEDLHSRTAKEINIPRKIAKNINFGLVYGLTSKGLSRNARISESDADIFLARFFKRYVGVKSLTDKVLYAMRNNGAAFYNLFGRHRTIPTIMSGNDYDRGRGERQAMSSLIQGTAAELIKESLVRLYYRYKEEGLDTYIVNTVHDEAQVDLRPKEIKEVAKITKDEMERFPEFEPIPIISDLEYSDTSWADKRNYKVEG